MQTQTLLVNKVLFTWKSGVKIKFERLKTHALMLVSKPVSKFVVLVRCADAFQAVQWPIVVNEVRNIRDRFHSMLIGRMKCLRITWCMCEDSSSIWQNKRKVASFVGHSQLLMLCLLGILTKYSIDNMYIHFHVDSFADAK